MKFSVLLIKIDMANQRLSRSYLFIYIHNFIITLDYYLLSLRASIYKLTFNVW